jgi:hypothetical protein
MEQRSEQARLSKGRYWGLIRGASGTEGKEHNVINQVDEHAVQNKASEGAGCS